MGSAAGRPTVVWWNGPSDRVVVGEVSMDVGDLGQVWTTAFAWPVRCGPEYSRGAPGTKRGEHPGSRPTGASAQGRKRPEAKTDVRARPHPINTSPG